MKRLMIILKENETLHEMMIGIVFVNIILAAAAFFVKNTRPAVYAVLTGCAVAIVFVIHMAVTLDDALCLDEKGAATVMRRQMIIRYVFVCVVFAAAVYFKIADPIFLTLSIITVKAGAYLQPTVHKILNRDGVK